MYLLDTDHISLVARGGGNDATLLTRDLVALQKVPDLRIEDWSV